MFEQRLRNGGQALAKISERVVDTSNELDIYPDPRLLSVGGQKPNADRLDPLIEKCDNARVARMDRSRTGQSEAAAPRRDELHSTAFPRDL